jgi:hypothetical protein
MWRRSRLPISSCHCDGRREALVAWHPNGCFGSLINVVAPPRDPAAAAYNGHNAGLPGVLPQEFTERKSCRAAAHRCSRPSPRATGWPSPRPVAGRSTRPRGHVHGSIRGPMTRFDDCATKCGPSTWGGATGILPDDLSHRRQVAPPGPLAHGEIPGREGNRAHSPRCRGSVVVPEMSRRLPPPPERKRPQVTGSAGDRAASAPSGARLNL